ncbi:DNA damage-inducible protein D [Tengunoibacter tsumagoiensis]|uniref:DNA damage-inducible protein D n=2 Tax=Tengunoibacter tsumagoiensis TaxID=2014871 RepID=A0A402A8K8_9CHLR|nr:DNA damage-inducible protein D [Tengunoibacter tsumagoiensis]
MGSPDFDSIKQLNVHGVEYWSARQLAPLLGYQRWEHFDATIQKAIIALQQTGQNAEDHFPASGKMVQLGSSAERELKDYALSRLACYIVAQNGNPRKPEIAAAQLYFALSTRTLEIHQLRKEQEQRLEMRLKVSESYKQLGETAQNAGVQSETFGIFIDAGYLGLHRHTLQELKEKKGIPEKEDYLDRIGAEELSAIDFKNTQTSAKIVRDEVEGLDEASQTHFFVGDQVRKAIEAIQAPMPEDMPSAASIRAMVEERRRVKKKKLSTKKSASNQEKLFE